MAAPAPLQNVGASTPADATSATGLASEAPVSVDTFPTTPPPEVLDAMASAATAYAALKAQGLTVHYSYDSQAHRASAELRDGEGRVVRSLSPSEAVALAAGEAPGASL